jgi:tetratricopeptide (TPR) repeat protein
LRRGLNRRILILCPGIVLLLAGLLFGQANVATPATVYRPSDPLNAAAFDHFYNLDYDRSIAEFEQIERRHPGDFFAVNHLLVAVLFRELNRVGALNSGEYANDSFINAPRRPVDPKAAERVKDLVHQAEELESKRLDSNPNDVDALYARGVTRAQFATYTALLERAWIAALRNAVGARRDHERVLELDSNYTQAKLIVGAHNYVMGNVSWPVKVAVAMVGLSGSKEKGLQLLHEAANGPGETAVDAKILLVVFLRRERRYDEALQIIRGLIPVYPRNLLLALEEGNLLRAWGHNAEAAAVYRKVWQAGREGHFDGLHYEMAAIALGDLLASQKDYTGAAATYEQVGELKDPDSDLLQRANLGAGQMYDGLQKRDLALKKYQAVVAANGSTVFAEAAKKCISSPCRPE